MALEIDDLKHLYINCYAVDGLSVPIESVEYFEKMEKATSTLSCKQWFDSEIDRLVFWISGTWSDYRAEIRLPIAKALRDILFCPLEDVPLYINGEFAPIAKWRLKNAK